MEGDRVGGRGAEGFLAPDGVAVHRRAVEGGDRCLGPDLRCQDPAGRLGEIDHLEFERLDAPVNQRDDLSNAGPIAKPAHSRVVRPLRG